MKCHYTVLGVSTDVTPDELKKAYRKLALEWHPDKNLHQLQEATKQFQLIQQAYEVLSDPQERAWYDRHKNEILKGGFSEYKDDGIDIFQYFNASCFSGYGDDEKGFYSVYRNVFDEIAKEDKMFMDDDDEETEIPQFGDSTSSYEEIVHPFYAYWQSYCTAKSYCWVDKYDIREAPNRRVLRLIEKENKKLRDQAKKSYNEEVRQLVAFVRKRDKRVQAYKKKLEEKNAENSRKMAEQRKRQILDRQKNFENYEETEWASMSQLEGNLKEIEAQLDKEFGKETNEKEDDKQDSDARDGDDDDLYCVACDKTFKSDKAFTNHENSKKHKENVAIIKEMMKEKDELFENGDLETCESPHSMNLDGVEDVLSSDSLNKYENDVKKKKKKNKKKTIKNETNYNECTFEMEEKSEIEEKKNNEDISNNEFENSNAQECEENNFKKKKQKEKIKTKHSKNEEEIELNNKTDITDDISAEKNDDISIEKNVDDDSEMLESKVKEKKGKIQKKKSKNVEKPTVTDKITCEKCHNEFVSRNKLFEHLKSTGHSMYLSSTKSSKVDQTAASQQKSSKSRKKAR